MYIKCGSTFWYLHIIIRKIHKNVYFTYKTIFSRIDIFIAYIYRINCKKYIEFLLSFHVRHLLFFQRREKSKRNFLVWVFHSFSWFLFYFHENKIKQCIFVTLLRSCLVWKRNTLSSKEEITWSEFIRFEMFVSL